ncbi:hypothetical protein JOM56_009762 [Amanita muscaria]
MEQWAEIATAHEQTLVDERAGNPKNIENVACDLKSRERCSFITMLKALMLRRIMMKDTSRKVFTATPSEWETVDQKFKTYLDDAVGFVNGPEGKSLRESLQTYCETPGERARYPHFVNVLNETLLHVRQLKLRGEEVEDGDIIFAINDPVVIESKHLDASTKRKPDLICLLAKRFRLLHEDCEHYSFHDCVLIASKQKATKSDIKEVTKMTWGDILQSWELEAKRKIDLEIHTDFKAENFLGMEILPPSGDTDESPVASTSQVQAVATSGVKRKRGSDDIPSSKKIKVDQPLSPLTPRAPKDVQCAFYGIERLRHSMDITHSMSVLLSDAKLTLFWYDSQGCIEANRINIIEELPLLVVMIRIFEDFPLGMWGYTPVDVWTEDKNKTKVPYCRKENPVGSFQIIGRRTFTGDATPQKTIQVQTASTFTTAANVRRSGRLNKRNCQPQPSSSSDEHSKDNQSEDEQSEDILFLKSAWPETTRRKEPEVIMEAYKRAEELLGTEARSVTDHLPVLVSFKGLAYTSTEIIRRLVKSTTTDGFCVQLWMLSKKLQPMHALDPKDFWTAFWHTLRCHSLLWRIGIAHGDVSLHNLMYKEHNKYGVLNDFDLSTIMEPGDRNPNRQGLERTGTMPFMALELLEDEGFDGKIPRRYDHELESFAWVLVWVSRCVVGGEECERPPPLNDWVGNNNDRVFDSKLGFTRRMRRIPTTPDYESLGPVILSWVDIWDNYHCEREKSLGTPVVEKTNSEYLQALIEACRKCSKTNLIATVPIDVSWVKMFTTPDGSQLASTSRSHLEEHPPLQQRSGDGSSPSDGSNRDMMSDDDMYVDDDGASLPNDTEFDDTDGDDDRQSGRDTYTHTKSKSRGTDDEERGGRLTNEAVARTDTLFVLDQCSLT